MTLAGISVEKRHMEQVISKSEFKPRPLHYFREVDKKGLESIIIECPLTYVIPDSYRISDQEIKGRF
jgi:hypothetical protein